mmetsp:Transcript_32696/g.38090  ORF Transcript_32696/g.38090 Transcript_32696/m.38090 type:complete len:454 (-) Transcript_32696:14-1375(-)
MVTVKGNSGKGARNRLIQRLVTVIAICLILIAVCEFSGNGRYASISKTIKKKKDKIINHNHENREHSVTNADKVIATPALDDDDMDEADNEEEADEVDGEQEEEGEEMGDDDEAAAAAVSGEETDRQRRIENIYKKMYKYHPPASASTAGGENDAVVLDDSCGSAPDFQSYFSQNYLVRSANNEDRFIYETFFKGDSGNNDNDNDNKDSSPHHYIELGAFDGVRESNTKFYDKCLGWEGLLIEGNPGKGIYDKLINNRPNSHRMNYVPSCNMTEESMNTTIPFHSKAFTNSGLEAVDTAYNGEETIDVPCGTMTQVLLDVFPPNGHVSFFSLDVEGSEHLVLGKALDLDKVNIEMLMIEVENEFCKSREDCAVRNKVRELMKEAEYVRFSEKVKKSDVFIRQDSKLLQKAIASGWVASIEEVEDEVDDDDTEDEADDDEADDDEADDLLKVAA